MHKVIQEFTITDRHIKHKYQMAIKIENINFTNFAIINIQYILGFTNLIKNL